MVNRYTFFSLNKDLMRLRRTTASSNKKGREREKKGEALISQQAPGMCFAFHPKVNYFSPLFTTAYNDLK